MPASSPEASPPEDPLDDDNNDGQPDQGSLNDIDRSAQQPPSPWPQQENPSGQQNEVGEDPQVFECRIEELRISNELIRMVRNAKLGDTYCMLGPEFVSRIRNPPAEPLVLDDPDLHASLDLYLATANSSQETYIRVREGVLRRTPEVKMLSLERIKSKVAELSGVYPIIHDMCINSCLAYTGVWKDLTCCPTCGEPRYYRGKARQKFYTLPIGPQLQALWRSPEGARNMRYREQRTQELLAELTGNNGSLAAYDDIFCGSDYLNQVIEGKIQSGDMALMFSLDGAQLYQSKASDTWIAIWVVLDCAPGIRYKKKPRSPWFLRSGPKPSESHGLLSVSCDPPPVCYPKRRATDLGRSN